MFRSLSGATSYYAFSLDDVTYHLFGEIHCVCNVDLCSKEVEKISFFDYLADLIGKAVSDNKDVDVYVENGLNWGIYDNDNHKEKPISATVYLLFECSRSYFDWQTDPETYYQKILARDRGVQISVTCPYGDQVRLYPADIRQIISDQRDAYTTDIYQFMRRYYKYDEEEIVSFLTEGSYFSFLKTYFQMINRAYTLFTEKLKTISDYFQGKLATLFGYQIHPFNLDKEQNRFLNQTVFTEELKNQLDQDFQIIYENLVKRDILYEDIETTLAGTYSQGMYSHLNIDQFGLTVYADGSENIIYQQYVRLADTPLIFDLPGKTVAEEMKTFLLTTYQEERRKHEGKIQEFATLYEEKPRRYYPLFYAWLHFFDLMVPLVSIKMDSFILPQLFPDPHGDRTVNMKISVTGGAHTEVYHGFFAHLFGGRLEYKYKYGYIYSGTDRSEKINACLPL